ncbi:MAG TPA: hypothetical protein VMP00_16295 [Burkholderiales bacterium]|nr:hypothetical protein [Burkholderiales bacterium]
MAEENGTAELKMDPANLYREEIYTDRRAGTLRIMTPVKVDGSPDDGRPVLYVGEAQLMTPVGALPLAFQIEATSLGEAAEKFAPAAKIAVERAVKELQQMRREAASSIVIPGGMPPGMGGLGGAGGLPGGGKIKLP